MLIALRFLSPRIIDLFLIVCRLMRITHPLPLKIPAESKGFTYRWTKSYSRQELFARFGSLTETSHFHIRTFDVEKYVLSCSRTSINTTQRSPGTLFGTFGTLSRTIFAFKDENMRKSRNDVPPLRNRIAAREGTIIRSAHAHFQNLLSK